jgi:hypothetical protein
MIPLWLSVRGEHQQQVFEAVLLTLIYCSTPGRQDMEVDTYMVAVF